MTVILVILLIGLGIFLLYCVLVHLRTRKEILKRFKNGNVIVSGRKGTGKDILFSYVINSRHDEYFSNLDYDDGIHYNNITLKEIELKPNDYNSFISGDIVKIKKNDNLEGKDIYLSDAGCYLPSQFDSVLHKTYPSMPLFFALNRHLYNNGMHLNAQRLDRIWKSLREQADTYILIRKRRLSIPFFFVIYTTVYDKYESALHELNPLNSRLFNKYSKAEKDKYRSMNGYIRNGFIFVRKSKLKYDSRAFHEILFGEKFNNTKKGLLYLLKHKNDINISFDDNIERG